MRKRRWRLFIESPAPAAAIPVAVPWLRKGQPRQDVWVGGSAVTHLVVMPSCTFKVLEGKKRKRKNKAAKKKEKRGGKVGPAKP